MLIAWRGWLVRIITFKTGRGRCGSYNQSCWLVCVLTAKTAAGWLFDIVFYIILYLVHNILGRKLSLLISCALQERISVTNAMGIRTRGLWGAACMIYEMEGLHGFSRGFGARILTAIPGTAISWSVYEYFKWFLKSEPNASDANFEPRPETCVSTRTMFLPASREVSCAVAPVGDIILSVDESLSGQWRFTWAKHCNWFVLCHSPLAFCSGTFNHSRSSVISILWWRSLYVPWFGYNALNVQTVGSIPMYISYQSSCRLYSSIKEPLVIWLNIWLTMCPIFCNTNRASYWFTGVSRHYVS